MNGRLWGLTHLSPSCQPDSRGSWFLSVLAPEKVYVPLGVWPAGAALGGSNSE